jgi:hypothetical protein
MRRALPLAMAWLMAGLFVAPACAAAEDQYNLFNPTPVDKMRDFSTDQPPLGPGHSRWVSRS